MKEISIVADEKDIIAEKDSLVRHSAYLFLSG